MDTNSNSNKHDMALALTKDHSAELEFDEDAIVLSILRKKLFRRAIEMKAQMPTEPPDIEKEAHDAVEDLAEATADLDRALSGMSDINAALSAWKEELSVGQAPQE